MLLELPSLNSLAQYFKSKHNNDIFEVKGVKISEVQLDNIICQNITSKVNEFNQSCAVAIYSLCYSKVKSSSYWNSNTLSSIVLGKGCVHKSCSTERHSGPGLSLFTSIVGCKHAS